MSRDFCSFNPIYTYFLQILIRIRDFWKVPYLSFLNLGSNKGLYPLFQSPLFGVFSVYYNIHIVVLTNFFVRNLRLYSVGKRCEKWCTCRLSWDLIDGSLIGVTLLNMPLVIFPPYIFYIQNHFCPFFSVQKRHTH